MRSHNRKVIAVADDFCKVHLFQYPCSKAKVRAHVLAGHGDLDPSRLAHSPSEAKERANEAGL